MHFEDDVIRLAVGQFHLCERIREMRIPCAAAVACAVGVDNQVALCIVAARGTHHVNEALGIVVDGIIGLQGYTSVILARGVPRSEIP